MASSSVSSRGRFPWKGGPSQAVVDEVDVGRSAFPVDFIAGEAGITNHAFAFVGRCTRVGRRQRGESTQPLEISPDRVGGQSLASCAKRHLRGGHAWPKVNSRKKTANVGGAYTSSKPVGAAVAQAR